MLKNLFSNIIYVKIYENKFEINTIEQEPRNTTIFASSPFSTERLLVGQFSIAEQTLKQGLKQISKRSIFAPSPIILIQPMEKIAGGLAEIEERAIHELAVSGGARKAFVWVGAELSAKEVQQRIESLMK